jgi:hypothetical protein
MVQKEEASGLEVGYRRNDKAIKDKLSCELVDDNHRVDRQGTAAAVTRDMRRKVACYGVNLYHKRVHDGEDQEARDRI